MESVTLVFDDEHTDAQIEYALRIALAHARAKSAELRTSEPARGRAWSIAATSIEDALYRVQWPVP